ncbi:MAG: hypothetical protein Q8S09_11630, partial [Hyphomonas sp.]|nr:hypothetical protein [Hyphomonas sp.]
TCVGGNQLPPKSVGLPSFDLVIIPGFGGLRDLLQKGRGVGTFPLETAFFSGNSLADSGKTH